MLNQTCKFKRFLRKLLPERVVYFLKERRSKIKVLISNKSPKEIFTKIKQDNYWGCAESVSGGGSTLRQTQSLVIELTKILKEKQIKTFLDIPCGDFNWIQKVDLSSIDYIGADIVDEIIEKNKEMYETNHIKFAVMDIIKDALPKSDIIFVRDCFIHLSYENIFEAIENIKKSGSKYLLTTTFPNRTKNYDIATGETRLLNLQEKPFLFPAPEKIIIENCQQDKDKSMGLWEIEKLRGKTND